MTALKVGENRGSRIENGTERTRKARVLPETQIIAPRLVLLQ